MSQNTATFQNSQPSSEYAKKPNPKSQPGTSYKGDYIDFEEVK